MAVLALSREYGSGGREVGRAVAGDLGYTYADRATVLEYLRTKDPRWERWGDELDESRPTVWERFDWSFRGYVALMQLHLLETASRDRAVIVGRGGNFLLEGVPTVCRIRIVAPRAARIERIMRREHLDHDTVRRLVERTDRERAGFIKAVYHRNWDDPAAYDRVYNTGLQDRDEIVALVKADLLERDRQDGAEAGRTLARRLAVARVRAALFTDPQIQLPLLEVAEEAGGIVVRGVVHSPEDRKRIRDTGCAVPVELPLSFDLRYR